MKLLIKQRVFAWGDTFDIYDEAGNVKYFVKGEVFSLGHKLHVYDMNDNEITWNLSATKAFKEKFTLKLEGYDLLNQRKNVQYAVTPQGRTVTVRNVLRRYAMAHFVWKFCVGKKKG